MKQSTRLLALITLTLLSVTRASAVETMHVQPTPKIAPLLVALLQPMLGSVIQSVSQSVLTQMQGGLGNVSATSVASSAANAAGSTLITELTREAQKALGSLGNNVAEGTPATPVTSPIATAPIQTASAGQPRTDSANPGFGYTVDMLDANTPSKVIGRMPLDQGIPTIRSGERFAIRFMTNLPGIVTIENIDANRVTASLGIYPVFPGADNRVPRDPAKGIKMYGSTGLETFRINYYPCITTESASQLGAQAATLGLPDCPAIPVANAALSAVPVALLAEPVAAPTPPAIVPTPTAAPSTTTTAETPTASAPTVAPSVFTLVSGKGGNLVPKAAMNEEIVGQNTAVTVATSYQPGQTMVQQFQMNHVDGQ